MTSITMRGLYSVTPIISIFIGINKMMNIELPFDAVVGE